MVLIKRCGSVPHTRGKENRGWGELSGPDGGRCFRTGKSSPAGFGLRYSTSVTSVQKRLLLSCFWGSGSWTWPGCDGLAPWASTASRPSSYSLKKKHCSLPASATEKPGSDQLPPFFLGVLYAYIYEYEYIVRMCMNVVVFFNTLKSMPGTTMICFFLLSFFLRS